MHNQMAMMEAQGRHDTFVTSANNLKKDEKRELKKFKDANRRNFKQENSAYTESAAGVSNMPTQNQSKVSSMAGGGKYDVKRSQKQKGGGGTT